MDKELEFISVGGYGCTGGTAALDLLKEFKGYEFMGTEFRLIKDPYGLMDLEDSIVNNWRNNLNSDVAIKDFLFLANSLGRNTSKFSKSGKNYSELLSNDFIEYTKKYIEKLVEYKFRGDWHLLRYKRNWFEQILNKVKRKLGLKEVSFEEIYYTKPNRDKFISETKTYLKKIFLDFALKYQCNKIILHNGIDSYNPIQGLNYFDSAKMILIDRDPRDIYVNLINDKRKSFLGKELYENKNVKIFVDDFLNRRENKSCYMDDKRILLLNFEDLILNYEDCLNKIYNFLGENDTIHINKFKYLKPEISKNNIGLWKNYKGKSEIEYIYNHLKSYCINV